MTDKASISFPPRTGFLGSKYYNSIIRLLVPGGSLYMFAGNANNATLKLTDIQSRIDRLSNYIYDEEIPIKFPWVLRERYSRYPFILTDIKNNLWYTTLQT